MSLTNTTVVEDNSKKYDKVAKPLPVLTEQQKDMIAINWQMDIKELTRMVFSNPVLDGRSIECKAVKLHLASLGRVAIPVPLAASKSFSLSEEQREYIQNNYASSTPLEMARLLFGDPNLLINSAENKMVLTYCRQLDPNYKKGEETVEGQFESPKNIKELIEKVNKYAINPKKDGKPIYDPDNLSSNDKKQLQGLLGYMKLTLFRTEGNKYMRKDDRELYESTFVSVCWDKPDLLSEEAIQYITFAAETVKYAQIERLIGLLDERLRSMLETPGGKINMSEVELLNSVREKSNASMKQSSALLKSLIGERAKRLNDRIQSSASMHNLVEMWRKEDDRRRIIQMNERKQKAALKAEVERLSDMDALKSEIFGLSKEDILN